MFLIMKFEPWVENFSGFSSIFFKRRFHNCVASVQQIFLKKNRLSQKIPFFRHFGHCWKVCGLLGEIVQKSYQNWILHVYWNPVKRFFEKNNIKFWSVLDIHRKTFGFLLKNPRQCCQTAYYLSVEPCP